MHLHRVLVFLNVGVCRFLLTIVGFQFQNVHLEMRILKYETSGQDTDLYFIRKLKYMQII